MFIQRGYHSKRCFHDMVRKVSPIATIVFKYKTIKKRFSKFSSVEIWPFDDFHGKRKEKNLH